MIINNIIIIETTDTYLQYSYYLNWQLFIIRTSFNFFPWR